MSLCIFLKINFEYFTVENWDPLFLYKSSAGAKPFKYVFETIFLSKNYHATILTGKGFILADFYLRYSYKCLL